MSLTLQRELPFDLESFEAWYARFCRTVLEPGKRTLERILQDHLQTLESTLGPGHFRPIQSRIKDSARVWAKLQSPKYLPKLTTVETIPDVIDDLIGLRVICTNKADLLAFKELLDGFLVAKGTEGFSVALEDGSSRDYVSTPKESGYRAYHVNMMTQVPQMESLHHVRGELQVRTLLQDGWGELTHEDTYKPGQPVPEIVEVLSLRMGQLLATVDDIAQDIQSELARRSQESLTSSHNSAASSSTEAYDRTIGLPPPFILEQVKRIVGEINQPTPLAVLANRMQGIFGTEIRDGWAGYGAFKDLLRAAVPSMQVIPVGPSYAIPPGSVRDETWPPSVVEYLNSTVREETAADPESS